MNPYLTYPRYIIIATCILKVVYNIDYPFASNPVQLYKLCLKVPDGGTYTTYHQARHFGIQVVPFKFSLIGLLEVEDSSWGLKAQDFAATPLNSHLGNLVGILMFLKLGFEF